MRGNNCLNDIAMLVFSSGQCIGRNFLMKNASMALPIQEHWVDVWCYCIGLMKMEVEVEIYDFSFKFMS